MHLVIYRVGTEKRQPPTKKRGMKQKQWITAAMAIMALILASCSTTQKSATIADATPVPAIVTEKVEANTEFISVAEAIDMFESP